MVRTGIIGIGKMGKYHLNLAPEIKGMELVGISDVDDKNLATYSSLSGVKGYKDYRDMLGFVDAVTIAAPTKYHYEIAKECLLLGKHILVEKPITTDYDQATELFEIAQDKNLVLHIGHVERFNGAISEFKKISNNPILIDSKRVGPFNHNFISDSIVLDLMIHDIDIIINIVGSMVKVIQVMGSPIKSSIADFASVNLLFENGTVAHIHVSRVSQMKERLMTIYEEDSLIVLDFTSQDINIFRSGQTEQSFGDNEVRYKNEFTQERLFVYKDNPLKLEITHFIDCVSGKKSREVTVEHDLRSLQVALIIDNLIKKNLYGEEVVL